MAPPCFSDLGKQAKDVFSKSYCIGLVKLDCKTKTESGVHFNASGNMNNDTGKVNAHLETKYTAQDYGLTVKEKWTTENVLSTELSVEDQLLKGLKVAAETNFVPQSGRKSATLKTSFQNEHINFNADMDIDEGGPILHLASVLTHQGWLAGAQASVDLPKTKLLKSSFGLGYSLNDFVVHSTVVNGQEFGGFMYQKINSNLQSGLQLSWNSDTNVTKFALGCVYKLDSNTSIRAKVNNSSQIGLSFTHQLRKGISLTLSSLLDAKALDQGGHKIGLGLEMES